MKKITAIGSCFALEMGRKMEEAGCDILINPFGVLFNPASIASSLNRLVDGEEFTMKDVILRDPNFSKGVTTSPVGDSQHRPIASFPSGYTSFFHHGSFTRATQGDFLRDANLSLRLNREHFLASDTVIVTFGTAWVFRHLEKGIIVSNCHKHIAAEFRREFLTIDEIVALLSSIIEELGSRRKWIFTVSPVRHLKDGLHGNQISKATLLLSIEELCRRFENVTYFPAYEIVLDELRDYSYFAEDKVHPTQETIDFVWERFRKFLTLED